MTDSQVTMYIALVCTSGVFTLFLCIYGFIRRNEISGARIFIWYTIAQAVYIFGCAFERASSSLQEIKAWVVVQYIGMPASAGLGLMLILHYIGRTPSRRTAALLLVIPAITLIMVATNDSHHLFYKSIQLVSDSEALLAEIAVGQWYVVHGIYTFGCLLAGVIALLSQWRSTKKAYRPQLITLICSQFIPMIAAFVYLMGAAPTGIDPVPVVLFLTSALYIWAMLTTGLLTVVPIAKDRIFESMREGVLVLDSENRLIDYNRSAGRMFPELSASMLGKSVIRLWEDTTASKFPLALREDDAQTEIRRGSDTGTLTYMVSTSKVLSAAGKQVGVLLMLIDVTEQKRLEEQLKLLAFHDSLTGIYNRAHFLHRSKELLAEAKATSGAISFILFDIDNFKQINDNYGHETGDQALRHVVDVCKQVVPQDILFARYGGEEFVLASHTPLAETERLAERLRTALETHPMTINGINLSITSSFGIAQSKKSDDTLDSLLRQADIALYDAKRSGRNRVRVYSDIE